MMIKIKTFSTIVFSTVIPLILLTLFLYFIVNEKSNNALEKSAKERIVSIRESKKRNIEYYLNTIKDQLIIQKNNPTIIGAMKNLHQTYQNYNDTSLSTTSPSYLLSNYYHEEFARNYKNKNPSKNINTSYLLENLSPTTLALQHHYIANNKNPVGEKHRLNKALSNTNYDQQHDYYHPYIRNILDTYGFYDIFLISQDSGDVIYSVYKELDYATSLITGPYANSGLAKAYQQAKKLTNKNDYAVVDFTPYTPSYESPAAFIASPIFDNGIKIGVLVFQMPIDRINNVMTADKKWQQSGLGLSGETYLVADDLKARSVSRFLIEDPEGFSQALLNTSINKSVLNEIIAKESNVGIQEIDTPAVRQALEGDTGYKIINDYRNVEVLSAYTPINFEGLNWVLLSEIDAKEAFLAAEELSNEMLLNSILGLLFFTSIAVLFGWIFSSKLTKPIIKLNKEINHINDSRNLKIRTTITGKNEISDICININKLLSTFESIIQENITATNEINQSSNMLNKISQLTLQEMEQQENESNQLATAMHEMVATVNDIASNAIAAADSAKDTDYAATQGQQVIEQAEKSLHELNNKLHNSSLIINELSKDSESITKMLDVISSIAEQTNLLALNAAIEAARAGAQGRGFAVVADEVRTLAARTQESTLNINDIIKSLQSRSEQAVDAMNINNEFAKNTTTHTLEAKVSFQKISQAVTNITDMNIQIASAAEEQSLVAEEINKNVINIVEISKSSKKGAEDVSKSGEQLFTLSQNLLEVSEQFK